MSRRNGQNRGARPGGLPDAALYALAGAALVCAGCIPAPGADNAFYVLLPYCVCVVSTSYAALLHHRIARGDTPDRREDPSTRPARLAAWLTAAVAGAFMTAAGEITHLLLVGTSAGFGYGAQASTQTRAASLAWMLAFIALALAAGCCLLQLRQRTAKS